MQFVSEPTLLVALGIAFGANVAVPRQIGEHFCQAHAALAFDPPDRRGWPDLVVYLGATLRADLGTGSGAPALVTFDGLSTSSAHFTTSTGTSGGVDYLAITRTS